MEINGIKLDINKIENLYKFIENNKENNRSGVIATIDLLGIDLTYRNKNYLDYFKKADMIFLDGAGVILAAKLTGQIPPPRLPGADLFLILCNFAHEKKLKIFLYGAKKEVIDSLNQKLRKKFPNIIISGFIDGYSKKKKEVITIIKRCKPDILFVAIGIPNQENFIVDCIKEINIPLSIGVGGTFDVHSGKLKRAPKFIQKIGFEWLFRLIQEPHRIKRIYRIPIFLLKLTIKTIFRKD